MDRNEASKLKALSDIASIDIALEFENILQDILKITCETMNAHSGTMMLVDEKTGELGMAASYRLGDDYIERVYEAAKKAGVPLTSSPSGTVLKTGRYYSVPNVFEEPKDKPWYGLSNELGFSSQIFTPMKRGQKVIGLLNVYMAEAHQFTDEEIDFVNIAASQASSVVHNAEKIMENHKKLYDSEKRYRELFENANDGIYTHDVEGYILTINDAALEILGCTDRDEVIGSNISRWLTQEGLGTAKEIIRKYVMGEPVEQPIILEIVRKSNEHRWVEFRIRIIKEGDRIVAIHGIGRDITEKMKLEQQLKEYHEKLKISYEELKEADRMKTEFVSNITHELLTPMTSIKGFTELLYNSTTGGINDEQKKSLKIILRNSQRLIKLINGLLDAAYLEKNMFELKFASVSMNDILTKAAQDVQPQAREKQITIIQEIPHLTEIHGEEERLTRVITNVLSNAIKFTPDNGKVTIAAEENSDTVKISIADTGIGIPADKLSRIFERFYQVDGSTTRKYGGVGLGLSICKGIIEKHNGLIWAESGGNGNGSTFHIVLPKKNQNI